MWDGFLGPPYRCVMPCSHSSQIHVHSYHMATHPTQAHVPIHMWYNVHANTGSQLFSVSFSLKYDRYIEELVNPECTAVWISQSERRRVTNTRISRQTITRPSCPLPVPSPPRVASILSSQRHRVVLPVSEPCAHGIILFCV